MVTEEKESGCLNIQCRKRCLALQALFLRIRDMIEAYLAEHYPEKD